MQGKEIEWWLGAKSGIRGTKQKYRKGERETVVDRGPKCSAEVRGLGKEGQWHRLQGQVGQGSRAGAMGVWSTRAGERGRKDKRGLGGIASETQWKTTASTLSALCLAPSFCLGPLAIGGGSQLMGFELPFGETHVTGN